MRPDVPSIRDFALIAAAIGAAVVLRSVMQVWFGA